MKRLLVSLAALPVIAAGLVLTSAPAYADDTVCSGTIGAVSLDGNVIVPEGATCKLLGTEVDGNVHVEARATLKAKGALVGGNIQAENHDRVVVKPLSGSPAQVGGSIQIKQGGGGKLKAVVVGSDIQLFTNDGLFKVVNNDVDGNLQCKSNTPPPSGGGNVVQGNKEDQCRNL